jgi:hypothetical protein
VTTPTVVDTRSICPIVSSSSWARASRPLPDASYPVKLASWPSTKLTPAAVMKPVITDVDTKRSSWPSRAAPVAIMTSPVTRARAYSDRSGSGREPRSTSATMIAHRAGGLDGHERGAGEQRAVNHPEQVGVQPGDRIDPGEEPTR